MYLFYIYVDLYFLCAYIHACVRTFLVNSLHALVMFNSGICRSFMSPSFRGDVYVSIGSLDQPLEVAITDDRTVSASDVYHDCMFAIFSVGFLIHLILILMRDV